MVVGLGIARFRINKVGMNLANRGRLINYKARSGVAMVTMSLPRSGSPLNERRILTSMSTGGQSR